MVYLIHFHKKFKHAAHYIGYCQDDLFDKRMECHRKNKGSKLIAAVNKAGIGWDVVRTWPDMDGNYERQLKNLKKSQCLCPKCCKKAGLVIRDIEVKLKEAA